MRLPNRTCSRRSALWLAAGLLTLAAPPAEPADPRPYAVLPQESRVTIHVGTAGLLGFLGHEHLVEAPLSRGRITWNAAAPERSEVRVEFDASRLVVLDPELDADKRARIQADMSGKVLDVERYPVIRFAGRGLQVEGSGGADAIHGTVAGTLSLHGVDAALEVPVELRISAAGLRVQGTVRFKGSRFGIERVSAGAGTVKTKDLLELTFDVVARPDGSP